jgi:hypothetical protein
MGKAVDTDRLAAARQIMSKLRENESFRDSVVAHDLGERPIVVALIDDPIEEVMARMKAIGLPVTLCVPGGSTSMTVVTVRPADAEEPSAESTPVAPGITVGMVMSYMWVKGGTVTFHVAEPAADLELKLV